MHKLILISLFSTCSLIIFGQLTVDAGSDAYLCKSLYTIDSLQLGGSPSASGGVPTYVYAWECHFEKVFGMNTYILTASDFLDDTTLANPKLINYSSIDSPEDTLEFILTVFDDISDTSKDTVKIIPSIFYTSIHQYYFDLIQGDSVGFGFTPNNLGGISPISYLWSPSHGLPDSTSFTNFWMKPDSSISYHLTITDSAGCVVVAPPCIFVNVGMASVANEKLKERIEIFPNPTSGYFNILLGGSEKAIEIEIYNLTGAMMIRFDNWDQSLDISSLPKGIYLLKITMDDRTELHEIILLE